MNEDIWIPKRHERYYCVGGDCSVESYMNNSDFDKGRIQCGNAFKTLKEAETAAAVIKKTFKYIFGRKSPVAFDASVFDHPDCPEWARYAVLEELGFVVFSDLKLHRKNNRWEVIDPATSLKVMHEWGPIEGFHTIFLERPDTEFPSWVKKEAYVFNVEKGGGIITDVTRNSCKIAFFDSKGIKEKVCLSFSEFKESDIKKGILRDFLVHELKDLLNRELTTVGAFAYGVSGVNLQNCTVLVNGSWIEPSTLKAQFSLLEDRRNIRIPCGVVIPPLF